MAQKTVLKVDVHGQKQRKKAMKVVSGFAGVDAILICQKDGKMTVTGELDPIKLVNKLRKFFAVQIESVCPVKKGAESKDGTGVQTIVPYPVCCQHVFNNPNRLPPPVYNDHHWCIEDDSYSCVIC
ncbi:hypothetical protein MLD38_009011 [Melastoma candidum]|uniref:Uncharacterized protein n=1 Tax=Melastoma candidum TaxID=119954 RepID=A0ACB9RWQ4_9MYRT|nr:hypothetical protein MLD38_009011 [Melastoma candidum]